jgi:hypothetical protein
MIDFDKVQVGDKLKIVGMGAPGFAKLDDIVTVTKTAKQRVDVTHDQTGKEAYFALTCGASRLEPVETGPENSREEMSPKTNSTLDCPSEQVTPAV